MNLKIDKKSVIFAARLGVVRFSYDGRGVWEFFRRGDDFLIGDGDLSRDDDRDAILAFAAAGSLT